MILSSVSSYAREKGLFRRGDRVLAAVSGGPDSVAMLDMLCRLRRGLGIELGVAHLDHGLRGAESVGDQRFVRALAKRLGLRYHCGRAKVAALARRRRISIETAARDARKVFLEGAARRGGYSRIATGHTADDQAETMLMHLIRGGGTDGLSGIPPQNGIFVRPLLGTFRREIVSYLDARRLGYRTDSSNLEAGAFRNRVRLELMPLLRKYNPRIAESLARTSEILAGDREALAKAAADAFNVCATRAKAEIAIDLQRFKGYNKGLRRNIIRLSCASLLGPGAVPDFGMVEKATALADAGTVGKRSRLTGGLWVRLGYGKLHIGRPSKPAQRPPARRVPLAVPGRLRFGEWSLRSSLVAAPMKAASGAPPHMAFFDRAGLSGRELWVGVARPGLRIRLFGSGRSRKVQDVMVDAKVPREERGSRPVVYVGEEPIWLAGIRRSDAAPVNEKTKEAVRLELVRNER